MKVGNSRERYLTKPLKLSKGMQSLLADPVTFSEEEKEDPVIRHLLDEDFLAELILTVNP